MWIEYVIRQGDYLAKLAQRFGFDAADVWADERNKELRRLREDPNVLYPGDVLSFPEAEDVVLPLAVGGSSSFVATVLEIHLTLVFRVGNRPMAREPYEVSGPAEPPAGRTDDEGHLRLLVPVHAEDLEIRFPGRSMVVPVRVGHLDPPETISGARGRLVNLGYYGYAGVEDDRVDELAFHRALTEFQKDHQKAFGLRPTGTLDAATSKALKAVHRH